MNRTFYDICYEVLLHYLHFPDVADTYKSVGSRWYYVRIAGDTCEYRSI